MIRNISVAAACVAASALAIAEENTGPWKGDAAVAFTQSAGNTDSENLAARANATHEKGDWRKIFHLEGANESVEGVRTKEKYYGSFKAEFDLTERSYLFGLAEYTKDRFSGFDYEAALSGGYGYQWFDNEIQKLKTDIGLGYRESELEDTGETEDEMFASLALDYLRNLNEDTTFEQKLGVDLGSEKTITKSYTKLKTRIEGSLFGFISYEIKHTSDVPDGVKNSDRVTMIGLDYTF